MKPLPVMNEYITTRYMTRFRCLGSACEDTCCNGWTVAVDKDHYRKLKRVMSQTREERERFRAMHQLVDAEHQTAENFATIQLRKEDGTCPMLDPTHLCSIQQRYGEEMLSNTCAFYPRVFSSRGARLEMTANLSCPEIGRLALLPADALELVPFDPKSFPHYVPLNQIVEPKSGYPGYIDEVRSAVFELLSLPEYPVSARLFFVTYFANRTVPFFSRSCAQIDETKLEREISRMRAPEFREELYQQYGKLSPSDAVTAMIIAEVLSMRSSGNCHPAFLKLVQDVFRPYSGNSAVQEGPILNIPMDRFIAEYTRRKALLESLFNDRFECYFENYAKNYWLKEWYGRSIDLMVHMQNLLIRIAVLRFLIVSLFQLPAEARENEGGVLLDREAVRVFCRFSRNIEHSRVFLDKLTQLLTEKNMQTLAYSACLLKF
ncbi:MAG TPA: flagellin lysine-N-methylase [Acidobacteriota bacterium]|nr:flagellin lysine-N-methylase [Acidobacteriota bacterium]